MGTRVIRQGGTVSQSFTWKDWRGVPWQRGSMQVSGHVRALHLVSLFAYRACRLRISAAFNCSTFGGTRLCQVGDYSNSSTWQTLWPSYLCVDVVGCAAYTLYFKHTTCLQIVTLAYDTNTADDWADLVEYAWGDATTTWGAIRTLNDSHPAPYNCTIFELGKALLCSSCVTTHS